MKTYVKHGVGLILLVEVLVAAWSHAQDIPLKKWPAPARWSPPRAHGLTTTETNPLPFIAVTPCRMADTRGNGFTGQAGLPILTTEGTRDFQIGGTVPGVPSQCGIPLSAAAVSFNFTVTDIGGNGNLIIYPTGAPQPTVSTLNYQPSFSALGNAAIVPLGTNASITVKVNGGGQFHGVDLIIDVNGYFPLTTSSNTLSPGESFAIVGSFNASGVISGTNSSVANSSAGISGVESATTGTVFGVFGQSASSTAGAAGVEGLSTSSTGTTYGLFGQTSSTGAAAAGVRGRASASTGATYGILGENSSTANESAGVKGFDSGGALTTVAANVSAGVRGDSALGVGVFGFSRATGVAGTLLNQAGGIVAAGYLGYSIGNYGMYANGDIGATGMKFFVEPHPADAAKVIRYVALEGPEAGTYFRGSARTERGQAIIEVPESFRLVTAEEGLTVQLTPVGDLVTLAVMSKDLRLIEVRSSRDANFDYEVKGVRRAFRSFQPITDSGEFIPASATAKLPSYLNEEARRRLIQNGTYNPDGSVNLSTAQRLGWLKAWEEREEALARANAGR